MLLNIDVMGIDTVQRFVTLLSVSEINRLNALKAAQFNPLEVLSLPAMESEREDWSPDRYR
ncbi:MAG TPA: hypothetical protein EYN13_04305 [Methylococcales bacterium]|nr:hypothetical protein [Methylococcales bacterium]